MDSNEILSSENAGFGSTMAVESIAEMANGADKAEVAVKHAKLLVQDMMLENQQSQEEILAGYFNQIFDVMADVRPVLDK